MRVIPLMICLLHAAAAAGTARLLVQTDVECRLTVDGKPGGKVTVGKGVSLALSPGEHRVEAVPLKGTAHWEELIKVTERDGQILNIPLRAALVRADAERLGYWTDPASHLTWAAADNGSGVTQSQAAYYCRALYLGGHQDWTLPSIDELQNLVGGSANDHGYHITGPVNLTGWQWSSSEGKAPGEAWALDFGDGGRASVVTGDSGLNRALCVRRP